MAHQTDDVRPSSSLGVGLDSLDETEAEALRRAFRKIHRAQNDPATEALRREFSAVTESMGPGAGGATPTLAAARGNRGQDNDGLHLAFPSQGQQQAQPFMDPSIRSQGWPQHASIPIAAQFGPHLALSHGTVFMHGFSPDRLPNNWSMPESSESAVQTHRHVADDSYHMTSMPLGFDEASGGRTAMSMPSTFDWSDLALLSPTDAVPDLHSDESRSSGSPEDQNVEGFDDLTPDDDEDVRKLSDGSPGSAGSGWSLVNMAPNQLRDLAPTSSNAAQWQSVDPSRELLPVRPAKKQRGKFTDQKKRKDTCITRRNKACVRCRMQKLRCDPDPTDPSGKCLTCKNVSHQRIYTLPCLRHKLTECLLFRRGKGPGLEFTVRWPTMAIRDIKEWASDEVRTIQVMSDVSPVPLQLKVRRFIPQKGDSTHRGWMDNKVKKFTPTTPWAIVDMRAAVETMRAYITDNIFSCVDYFLQTSDEWVRETYQYARKHMIRIQSPEEKKLLGNFFRLWFAIRRTATIEHLVGKESLGMSFDPDERSPYNKKIPLPPVMIQQLDIVLTLGVLDKLQSDVLEGLQSIVMDRKPNSWMTVYLITFMSMHDCARITEENYRNARKHGLIRRYSMPSFMAERHHGANVFLSHYHYLNQVHNAFKTNWTRRHVTPFSEFSTEDIHFIRYTQDMVKERQRRMHDNLELDLYEDELYFIAQMFEEDWRPRSATVDNTVETVNNVPLRKNHDG